MLIQLVLSFKCPIFVMFAAHIAILKVSDLKTSESNAELKKSGSSFSHNLCVLSALCEKVKSVHDFRIDL